MEISTILIIKCLELKVLNITGEILITEDQDTMVLIMALVMDTGKVEDLESIVHLWPVRKTMFHSVDKELELMAQIRQQTLLLLLELSHNLQELVLRTNLLLTMTHSRRICKTPWKVLSKLILVTKIFKTR